jgi:hypothetical protein
MAAQRVLAALVLCLCAAAVVRAAAPKAAPVGIATAEEGFSAEANAEKQAALEELAVEDQQMRALEREDASLAASPASVPAAVQVRRQHLRLVSRAGLRAGSVSVMGVVPAFLTTCGSQTATNELDGQLRATQEELDEMDLELPATGANNKPGANFRFAAPAGMEETSKTVTTTTTTTTNTIVTQPLATQPPKPVATQPATVPTKPVVTAAPTERPVDPTGYNALVRAGASFGGGQGSSHAGGHSKTSCAASSRTSAWSRRPRRSTLRWGAGRECGSGAHTLCVVTGRQERLRD